MRQSRDEKVGFQNPRFTDIYKILYKQTNISKTMKLPWLQWHAQGKKYYICLWQVHVAKLFRHHWKLGTYIVQFNTT